VNQKEFLGLEISDWKQIFFNRKFLRLHKQLYFSFPSTLLWVS